MIFRRRQHSAVFQGDHRDRRAPVTLTGNAPVAQTVVHFTFADAFFRQFIGNGVKRRFKGQAVELAGVKQHAFFGQRLFGKIRLGTVGGQNHRLDGQTVFGGKFVVALIVTRNGHHRASAVLHQDKVCRPDRDLFAS
ncbi:Uncharacterised protein [Salmonella enterica subsp. enterica serovar Bovismorbificans]|nr:Uncharacterised protein [Salmonella enterica subsp. enterica serovar Bovismorbificans]